MGCSRSECLVSRRCRFWRKRDTLPLYGTTVLQSPGEMRREGRKPLPLLLIARPSGVAPAAHGVALGGTATLSAVKAFIIVNRRTRKIVAEFETREEAEAFRDG